jgi:hypothetical protein
MKRKDIIFTDTMGIPEEYHPKPSNKFIPEWYQKTVSYITGSKKPIKNEGNVSFTIKKCLPVFDAITAGYIIVTYCDIYVSKNEDGSMQYDWPSREPLAFHPIEQAPHHPKQNGFPYPKIINPWSIKTPKGYSVLVTQPFHRDAPFTILDGIVDTDKYNSPIHFPFVINDTNWEGLIPAGTPLAQIIPFKRESWNMSLGDNKDRQKSTEVTTLNLSVFFNRYKSFFWTKKDYK